MNMLSSMIAPMVLFYALQNVVYGVCLYMTQTCPCNMQGVLKSVKMIILDDFFYIFFFCQNIDSG